MKRFLLALLMILLLLTGCGKSANALPSLGAISPLPESTIKEIVQQYDRDTLLSVWGVPLRTMEGNCGDVWQLSDQREILVLYNENGRVFAVRLNN